MTADQDPPYGLGARGDDVEESRLDAIPYRGNDCIEFRLLPGSSIFPDLAF